MSVCIIYLLILPCSKVSWLVGVMSTCLTRRCVHLQASKSSGLLLPSAGQSSVYNNSLELLFVCRFCAIFSCFFLRRDTLRMQCNHRIFNDLFIEIIVLLKNNIFSIDLHFSRFFRFRGMFKRS